MGSVKYNGSLYENIRKLAVHNNALLLLKGDGRTILLSLPCKREDILIEFTVLRGGYRVEELTVLRHKDLDSENTLYNSCYHCIYLSGCFEEIFVDDSNKYYVSMNSSGHKPVVNRSSKFCKTGYSVK